jgi:hypothetical protein
MARLGQPLTGDFLNRCWGRRCTAGCANVRLDKLGSRATGWQHGHERVARRPRPDLPPATPRSPRRSRKSWPGSSIAAARPRRGTSMTGTTFAARCALGATTLKLSQKRRIFELNGNCSARPIPA